LGLVFNFRSEFDDCLSFLDFIIEFIENDISGLSE